LTMRKIYLKMSKYCNLSKGQVLQQMTSWGGTGTGIRGRIK